MKKHLHQFVCVLAVAIFIGCSEETPTVTSTVDGTWRYESNISGSCNDLVGTTVEISNGVSTAIFVPDNRFGWKTGERFLSNITQTTSPNNFTAMGYSRNAGGAIADPNIKVNLAVAAGAQSMTITYTNVCNPIQKWVKN